MGACDGPRYTVRANPQKAQPSSNSLEIAFVKSCTPTDPRRNSCKETAPRSTHSASASIEPAAIELLAGAAIVILAHDRANDLKTCLESLVSQVDVGLFRIHVSLDSAKAAPVMRDAIREVTKKHGTNISIWEVEPKVPDPQTQNDAVRKWFEWNTGKIAHHYHVVFERTLWSIILNTLSSSRKILCSPLTSLGSLEAQHGFSKLTRASGASVLGTTSVLACLLTTSVACC